MNRIKLLRTSAGMSQAQLGAAVGCVGQTISKLETESRQLDPATIFALCDLFGCTADYLLGRSDTPLPVISDEDALVLESYHSLPLELRRAVDAILEPYREPFREKKDA